MIFQPKRAAGCPSDLALDRWMAGELDPAVADGARDHLAGCAACRARLAALEADRAGFRAAPPALRRPVARTAPPPSRLVRWRWRWPVAGALAAAVALALVWSRSVGDGDGTRLKGGGVRLAFFVQRGGEARRGGAGDVVHPGERVRLAVSLDEVAYLVVASRDGAGAISVYHPAGERAEAIGPGDELALPDALELDGALGDEVVIGFFCRRPVAVAAVRAAVAAGTDAVEDCRTDRLTWRKRAP